MIELTITVWDREEVEVPFYLKTLPLLTPANMAAPLFGSWFCTSPYLGNTSTGNYYIKKVADPECTDEQRWISGCRGSSGQMGFFFDSHDPPFCSWTLFI